MDKVTFCIAVYKDTTLLIDTLASLQSTMQGYDYDVVVIDDANTIKDELVNFPNIKLFGNQKRRGVGYSLDLAVNLAETELVFFMGCDIRFSGDWFPRFYQTVKEHPTSLVSTVTAGLNLKRLQITGKENHMYGSYILFRITKENNTRVLPFREYLECKWNPKLDGDVVEIGAILGAFYGAHKSWYQKIGGFSHHRTWGTLEPLISLRSYMHGGNCVVDTKTITGHIFKSASSEKPIQDLIYNKLLVAYTLLPTDMEKQVFDWVKGLKYSTNSFKFLQMEQPELDKLRALKLELGDEELKRRYKPTGLFDH